MKSIISAFILIILCHFTSYSQTENNLHFIRLNEATKYYSTCEKFENIRTDHCNRCASWSIEFRRQNTCPGCRNRGTVIGARKCRKCKGEGKIIDWYKTEKLFLENNTNYSSTDIIFYATGKNFKSRSPENVEVIDGKQLALVSGKEDVRRMKVETYKSFDENGNGIVKTKLLETSLGIQDERELNFIINQFYPGFQLANTKDISSFLLGEKKQPYPVFGTQRKKLLVTEYKCNNSFGRFHYIPLTGNLHWGHYKGNLREKGLASLLKTTGFTHNPYACTGFDYKTLLIIKKENSSSNRRQPDQISHTSTIEKIMTQMYVQHIFRVFDREGTNYMKKLKIEELETVKSRTLSRLKRELGDELKDLDMSKVDDTFINYLIDYMVKDRKMYPFYVEYTPDNVYKLSYDIVEAKGLEKVLLEQGYSTSSEKVYIQYDNSGDFKLVGGPDGKNNAVVSYNRLPNVSQPVSGPDKDPVKAPIKTDDKPAVKTYEKRPEEELGVENNKLLNDIYKKASAEGIDSVSELVSKHFTARQQRIIKSVNSEGYAVLKPINPYLYEEMDVKARFSEDFEPFKEFKMYKLKTDNISVGERAKSIKELNQLQSITKKECKEIIEQYYEMGKVGVLDISDEERRSAARQVCRCRRQHNFGERLDFAKIGDKLNEIGSNKWAQDPNSGRFMINYNNQTVGTDNDVLSLKK